MDKSNDPFFVVLLHKIVTPLVMAVLFFAIIMPIGLILRAIGKDLLRLKIDPKTSSYWIDRDVDETPSSMTRQF